MCRTLQPALSRRIHPNGINDFGVRAWKLRLITVRQILHTPRRDAVCASSRMHQRGHIRRRSCRAVQPAISRSLHPNGLDTFVVRSRASRSSLSVRSFLRLGSGMRCAGPHQRRCDLQCARCVVLGQPVLDQRGNVSRLNVNSSREGYLRWRYICNCSKLRRLVLISP